jgi:hypothetical protein
MQIKFNYTSGGEFTLNGQNYIGYFNVDDKYNAYSGKYYNSDSLKLESESKYSSDYYTSSSFKDRRPFDEENLPYGIDYILIKSTEFINHQIINKHLNYFEDNLQYLYSKMFVGATDNPINSVFTLTGDNTGTFTWTGYDSFYESTSASSIVEQLSSNSFYGIKRFVVTKFHEGINGFCILGITDTSLIGLSSDSNINENPTSITLVLSSDLIDNKTDQKCSSLEDIAFNGTDLYITDSKINGGGQVFKYNIGSYITNDAIFEFKRFLIEQIGGFGSDIKNDKFAGCTVIESDPEQVWVYDSGNKVIKVYDNNFVWKKTFGLPDRSKVIVLDIAYRKMNDHFYVLYKNEITGNFGYCEYDKKFSLINAVIFDDVLYTDTDKQFNKMCISEQDSNVFYVVTEQTIFKKFFSKPNITFATFDRNKFMPKSGYNLRDIYCIGDDFNSDKLFVLANGFFVKLIEKTNYETVFSNPDIEYFNLKSVSLTQDEYVQAFTFNKEIYKLLINVLQFRNYLIGRFIFKYNEFGDLTYRKYGYIPQEYFKKIDPDAQFNAFVHDNELTQANVINRAFRFIYKIQLDLLEQTKASILNIKSVPNEENALIID